jgi:hypothetical protein
MRNLIQRVLGLLSFLAGGVWVYGWEAFRAYLYESGFEAFGLIGVDKFTHYGVPILFGLIGLALFYYSRPRTVRTPMNMRAATATSREAEVTEEEIPLREAATRANEELKDTRGGRLARGLNKSSDEILSYYCYALADKIPIYGQLPPSRRKEQVDLNSGRTRIIVFEGNTTHARSLYSGEEGASNLYVLKSHLVRAIQALKVEMT